MTQQPDFSPEAICKRRYAAREYRVQNQLPSHAQDIDHLLTKVDELTTVNEAVAGALETFMIIGRHTQARIATGALTGPIAPESKEAIEAGEAALALHQNKESAE